MAKIKPKKEYLVSCDNKGCRKAPFPWAPTFKFAVNYTSENKKTRCPKCGRYMKVVGVTK